MATQSYAELLSYDIRRRAAYYPPSSRRVRFSVLTALYSKSHVGFFLEAAQSLRLQTYPNFEWVVLAQGDLPSNMLAALATARRDSRLRILTLNENEGIMAGLRRCLEASTGDYALPLDADDLLTPDALEILSSVIESNQSPAFVYSDEDFYSQGTPQLPYQRPDWDPILNLSSSYVWHVSAFRRTQALELGVFQDTESNWCQDWDTLLRFISAGETPIHVPEVLYHWRSHESSSTNRPDPESGSLKSQKHILELHVQLQPHPELYEVVPFPIFRGSLEWWIRRRPESPASLTTIVLATDQNAAFRTRDYLHSFSGFPFADVVPCLGDANRERFASLKKAVDGVESEFVVLLADGVRPEGTEWAWEAQGLFEFHSDLALVGARLLDKDRKIVAGGEIFGFHGLVGTPNRGGPADDPGLFALALKPRSVSAVDGRFFVARTRVLKELLATLPPKATWQHVGAWLGAAAKDRGLRVAFSPVITGLCSEAASSSHPWDDDEKEAFLATHRSKVPDLRWFPAYVGYQDRPERSS